MTKTRILVVDDEETIRKLLKSRLERDGLAVETASNAAEAEAMFNRGGDIGVIVTDLKMPGKDGFGLMAAAKQAFPLVKVVVITGHGEKDVAVKALRQGACDYLEKPFDLDQLAHAVKRGLREHQLERDNAELMGNLQARVERVEGKAEDKYWYVSKSPAMGKVNEWLTVLRRESLRGDAEEPTVLIVGESGTGKEGLARMVHAGSRRGKGPWVAVNCANFNEQLLESELFGHERGAFTGATNLKKGLFEIARGGTLFLDEIGEMDPKLQAKLLRVLQEKVFRRVGGTADLESDVRVVAATNRNLPERVKGGQFREDLYHRLSRVVVDVPALRERIEDLVPMATEFAARAFRSRGKSFDGFTPEAQSSIRGYGWPGNVRELLNVVERAALLWSGHGMVGPRELGVPGGAGGDAPRTRVLDGGAHTHTHTPGPGGYMELKKLWSDAFEKEYLLSALQRHGGNVSAAAREARIDRSNFLRLLRRHELKAQGFRKVGEVAADTPATGTDGQQKVAA
jgi:DNA-binding NtrC family response regulator